MSIRRFLLPLILIASLGAGCFPAIKPVEPNVTSTEAGTGDATSTPPVVAEPKRWDRVETPTGIAFTPPKGYWVYAWEAMRLHYLIPGTPPEPGSPDPGEEAIPRAVAIFGDLQNDPASFPNWEGFEVTAAQFGCTSGNADNDFVTCRDTDTTISTGKTAGDFLYRQFRLPLILQSTGASRGTRTFVSVRFGAQSDNGMLITVVDSAKGQTPALSLAKSMQYSASSLDTVLKSE